VLHGAEYSTIPRFPQAASFGSQVSVLATVKSYIIIFSINTGRFQSTQAQRDIQISIHRTRRERS